MSRLRAFLAGLDARTGASSLWRHLANEPVAGGARWAYVFGSVLAFLVLVQAVTGATLALEYAATTSSAHESLVRLMDASQVSWGRLVRGLHHHGATVLVIAMACHVIQVALSRAYRRPRELNWLTGLALGLMALGLAFTGYLLPWDQTAFYATRVGLNIMRSVPLIGTLLADVLQGGPTMGNLTLTRFYALHVLVLPAKLALLLAAHLVLFRRHGVTPANTAEGAESLPAEPFWPGQALRDVVAMAAAFGLLLALVSFAPVELGAKADPSVAFDARPEWYFLWLFELLHHFEPPIEWMATLVVPGALVLFLALLPWLDRARGRGLWERRRILLSLAAVGLGLVALTVLPLVRDARSAAETQQDAPAEPLVVAARPVAPLRAAIAYGEWCTECHAWDGSPIDEDAHDLRSPDIQRMARADFEQLVTTVKEGGEIMPGFGEELSDPLIRAILTEVVLSFGREDAARDAEAGIDKDH